MITVNIRINEKAYEKVMHILNSLPKSDVSIINQRVIEEIDPTELDRNDFDYMSKDELIKMDKLIKEAREKGLDNLKTYDELKDEL